MSTISNIADRVLQRLEEDPAAPVFWDRTLEVYPLLVEAMNEASLLSGVVQVAQVDLVTIPPSTTYLPMPVNALALLRIQGPFAVQKTDLTSLDAMIPGWELVGGEGSGFQQIQAWFPVGLTSFGVYPQLEVEQQVRVSYLAYPVGKTTPYDGTETVPFQQEFQDGLEDYAAHVLRLKEAGYEFQASQQTYQEFLDTMRTLSVFQARRDSLVFSRASGAKARVSEMEVR